MARPSCVGPCDAVTQMAGQRLYHVKTDRFVVPLPSTCICCQPMPCVGGNDVGVALASSGSRKWGRHPACHAKTPRYRRLEAYATLGTQPKFLVLTRHEFRPIWYPDGYFECESPEPTHANRDRWDHPRDQHMRRYANDDKPIRVRPGDHSRGRHVGPISWDECLHGRLY
jgi:hypothetical protein